MRINELVHVLSGLLLLATSLECGKSDHVHLKIHIPDIIHKHKHVKTKYVHIFHPKAVHSDHTSVQFLHSRKDPNHGLAHGYAQPSVNVNHRPELRITEAEFQKWRHEQYMKALEEQQMRDHENENENENEPTDEDEGDVHETKSEEEAEEEDELYKKHKANKANSSSTRKESSKHGNHNYNHDYEASNSDKTYTNYPSRTRKTNKKKPFKPSPAVQQTVERPRKKQQKLYGFAKQHEAEASNISPHVHVIDQTSLDPTYYSTLPKDQSTAGSDNQDDIYSGLLSARYTKKTADKSKLLGDINYNRKKQTKAVASQNRRTQ